MQTSHEHPFAQYIRALGKGKQGSRALTQDEAYTAMRLILRDEVEPIQLGAFLMLMRMKEETAAELAGFVEAVRDELAVPHDFVQVDLDWSSYAGKRRHLPWFILSALLLSENGVRVFMHGATGHTHGRLYTEEVLAQLGIEALNTWEEVAEHLETRRFAFLPLSQLSPKLNAMMALRPLMGLRSPVHTLVRLLNPLSAPYMLQGIFHPSYRAIHQETAVLLKQPHLAVLKGEGGEIERNPDLECLVQSVHLGEKQDELWSPLFEQRHVKAESLDIAQMPALWRGELQDEFAEASVVGTVAVALKLMGKADSIEAAEQAAKAMWAARNQQRF
jgi:anthranilate phosphoribosyltransferase